MIVVFESLCRSSSSLTHYVLRNVAKPLTGYKYRHHENSLKMKPKYFDGPMVDGCSVGHKSFSCHVNGCDMSQMFMSNKFFQKVVSVILYNSYNAEVFFFGKFVFNQLFDDVKRRCDVMINSCSQISIKWWDGRGKHVPLANISPPNSTA